MVKKEIWIIDDEEFDRNFFSKQARENGLEPVTFKHPKDAVEELSKRIKSNQDFPIAYLCDMKFEEFQDTDRISPFLLYTFIKQSRLNEKSFYFISNYLSEREDIPRLKYHNLLNRAFEKDDSEILFEKIVLEDKR